MKFKKTKRINQIIKKFRKEKMNEETNEDAGSSFVEDNFDDASSIHVDGDLEPEIIDEIEQEQAEMYLPTSN